MLDGYKELTPVVYGESAIKPLVSNVIGADRLCFGIHWHDRMEINLVVSGSMMLHTDEGLLRCCRDRQLSMHPGKCMERFQVKTVLHTIP